MVIRPMAAAYMMGEIGRSAGKPGEKGGLTSFSQTLKDEVMFGAAIVPQGSGYSASPLFKMMGAVQLMSTDADHSETAQYI